MLQCVVSADLLVFLKTQRGTIGGLNGADPRSSLAQGFPCIRQVQSQRRDDTQACDRHSPRGHFLLTLRHGGPGCRRPDAVRASEILLGLLVCFAGWERGALGHQVGTCHPVDVADPRDASRGAAASSFFTPSTTSFTVRIERTSSSGMEILKAFSSSNRSENT